MAGLAPIPDRDDEPVAPHHVDGAFQQRGLPDPRRPLHDRHTAATRGPPRQPDQSVEFGLPLQERLVAAASKDRHG
jgi:hypothetical protein